MIARRIEEFTLGELNAFARLLRAHFAEFGRVIDDAAEADLADAQTDEERQRVELRRRTEQDILSAARELAYDGQWLEEWRARRGLPRN